MKKENSKKVYKNGDVWSFSVNEKTIEVTMSIPSRENYSGNDLARVALGLTKINEAIRALLLTAVDPTGKLFSKLVDAEHKTNMAIKKEYDHKKGAGNPK